SPEIAFRERIWMASPEATVTVPSSPAGASSPVSSLGASVSSVASSLGACVSAVVSAGAVSPVAAVSPPPSPPQAASTRERTARSDRNRERRLLICCFLPGPENASGRARRAANIPTFALWWRDPAPTLAGGKSVEIEELASRDSYLDRAEGNVVEVGDGAVVLDRTVFYARGGGQPGDTGIIRWDGGEVRVTDTIRRDGKIVHIVESGEFPDPGTPVEGVIDWDRRYTIMRTHTALHALS